MLEGHTPYDAWYRDVPDLCHMQAFGSTVDVGIPSVKLQKLNDHSRHCVMIGYLDMTGGYLVADIRMGAVTKLRDVVFHKDPMSIPVATDGPSIPFQAAQGPTAPVISKEPTIKVEEEEINFNSSTQPLTIRLPGCYHLSVISVPANPAQNVHTQNIHPLPQPAPLVLVKQIPDFPHGQTCSGNTRGAMLAMSMLDTMSMESAFSAVQDDPSSYSEAIRCEDKEEWLAAMDVEMMSLADHDTWDLVLKPEGKKVIGSKWVLRGKHEDSAGEEEGKACCTWTWPNPWHRLHQHICPSCLTRIPSTQPFHCCSLQCHHLTI
jgi:hypothetical protein